MYTVYFNDWRRFTIVLHCVICRCLADEVDLTGLQIDEALRSFQSYFRMPVSRRFFHCNWNKIDQVSFNLVDDLRIFATCLFHVLTYPSLSLSSHAVFRTLFLLIKTVTLSSSFIVRFPCYAQVGRFPPFKLLQLALSNAQSKGL